jgi:UDP-3-O-[3-hydroxymyristoyl] glucosamine N-acyltransferase
VGIVRIDDDVEIGQIPASTGRPMGTWIKSGVKIDNLVQIGHTVVVGETPAGAQAGIPADDPDAVVMGGQAAATGHIHIEDRVMVAARGAVHDNQPKGAIIGGAPAIPIRTWTRAVSIFAKLPEIYSDFKRMKKYVAELQARDEEKGVARREA